MSRLVLLGMAALLALSGCGSGSTPAESTPGGRASSDPSTGATSFQRYVALGDSYTAAPYVYLTDVAKGCLRSNGNYPSLLAKDLGLTAHVDVSCSGATSKDLATAQNTFKDQSVPPQLAAVTADTDLVTLGIGGNDRGLFGSLVGTCTVRDPRGGVFAPRHGVRCGQVAEGAIRSDVRSIGGLIKRDLRRIHRMAPHAKVVLVGYPRIVSPGSSCDRTLPVAPGDAVVLDRIARLLSTTMHAAARRTGSLYVDMYAESKGHDVCSGKGAWVNGVHTDTNRAAALHPFAKEQRAVADLIAKQLVP